VAADYVSCLKIVEERVKPERTRKKPNGEFALRRPLPQKWWIYADKRPELYRTIAGLERVLAVPLVSKFMIVSWEPVNYVFSHALGVISSKEDWMFAIAQCTFHEEWARHCGSTLETRMRYTPSDCFETFPFPADRSLTVAALKDIGETYHEHRRQIMLARQEGLTKTYNRFHDPDETSVDIQKLRQLHVAMDHAVAAAYGWTDLALGHNFHATKQGRRYTLSEAARREVLGRLLKLNHERYAEEVAKGVHEKKKPRTTRTVRKKKMDQGGGMFG
jgi:hypothetical protein